MYVSEKLKTQSNIRKKEYITENASKVFFDKVNDSDECNCTLSKSEQIILLTLTNYDCYLHIKVDDLDNMDIKDMEDALYKMRNILNYNDDINNIKSLDFIRKYNKIAKLNNIIKERKNDKDICNKSFMLF